MHLLHCRLRQGLQVNSMVVDPTSLWLFLPLLPPHYTLTLALPLCACPLRSFQLFLHEDVFPDCPPAFHWNCLISHYNTERPCSAPHNGFHIESLRTRKGGGSSKNSNYNLTQWCKPIVPRRLRQECCNLKSGVERHVLQSSRTLCPSTLLYTKYINSTHEYFSP